VTVFAAGAALPEPFLEPRSAAARASAGRHRAAIIPLWRAGAPDTKTPRSVVRALLVANRHGDELRVAAGWNRCALRALLFANRSFEAEPLLRCPQRTQASRTVGLAQATQRHTESASWGVTRIESVPASEK